MSGRNDEILSLIDTFCDAGRDLAKAIAHAWLEAQAGDQAETSTRIVKEIAPPPSDKRELTVKELAARWGVSTRSIYEWKTTKGLPYIPHGRCLRFDWVEVDAWSKRHRESFTRARLRVVR
jgi:excisionase family DNA binding protein